jgi:hypothetical protein
VANGIFERALELCDEEETDAMRLARVVWLRAQGTNLGQPSKELMVAFAEAMGHFEGVDN